MDWVILRQQYMTYMLKHNYNALIIQYKIKHFDRLLEENKTEQLIMELNKIDM